MVSCFSAGGQRRSLSDDATRSCRSVLRRMRLVGEEREREREPKQVFKLQKTVANSWFSLGGTSKPD